MDIQKSMNRRDFFKVAGATGLAGMAFAGGIPSLALANTRKVAANPAITDLFFYSQPVGRGEFYGTDGLGHIDHLSTYSAIPKCFAQILSGSFVFGSVTEGMLFYDNAQGSGTFYIPDRKGGLDLLKHHTGWRKTWTHIINGRFVPGSSFDDLLFYDANSGVSEFYSTDGVGRIHLLKHDVWLRHWTQILSGPFVFNPSGYSTGLFFYDRSHGIGEFYSINANGGISLLRRHTGLRTTWTTVISTDLGMLFYDANSGVSEFYHTNGQGGLLLVRRDMWSKGWTHIVPSRNFVYGTDAGGLLFYNSNTGASAFYRYTDDARGEISLLRRDTWRKGWTRILENAPI